MSARRARGPEAQEATRRAGVRAGTVNEPGEVPPEGGGPRGGAVGGGEAEGRGVGVRRVREGGLGGHDEVLHRGGLVAAPERQHEIRQLPEGGSKGQAGKGWPQSPKSRFISKVMIEQDIVSNIGAGG